MTKDLMTHWDKLFIGTIAAAGALALVAETIQILKPPEPKILVQETTLRKEYSLECLRKNPRHPISMSSPPPSACEILPRKPETTLSYEM